MNCKEEAKCGEFRDSMHKTKGMQEMGESQKFVWKKNALQCKMVTAQAVPILFQQFRVVRLAHSCAQRDNTTFGFFKAQALSMTSRAKPNSQISNSREVFRLSARTCASCNSNWSCNVCLAAKGGAQRINMLLHAVTACAQRYSKDFQNREGITLSTSPR